MQEKTKAKLRDTARPQPDRNATRDLRGSAYNAFDLKCISVLGHSNHSPLSFLMCTLASSWSLRSGWKKV